MSLFRLSRQQNRTLEILVGCLVLFFSTTGFLLLWHQATVSSSEADLYSDIVLSVPRDSYTSLWLRVLLELHTHLLMGPVGSMLVFLSGLAILTVSITGMSRWAGWKRPEQGFRIRRTLNSRMLLFDIHNTLGAISFFFLIIIGMSGTLLSLASLLQNLGIGPPGNIKRILSFFMGLAGGLHKASYQSNIAFAIYGLFAISIMLIAITGITMGVRNIYRKYKRSSF